MVKRKANEEFVKVVSGDGSIFEIDLKGKRRSSKELPGQYKDLFAERGQINRKLAKFLNREQKIVYERD